MSKTTLIFLIAILICIILDIITAVFYRHTSEENKPFFLALIASLSIGIAMLSVAGIVLTIRENNENQKKQELTDYIEQTDDIATIYINGIRYSKQSIDVDTILNHYTLDHIDAETDAVYLTD